MAAVPVKARAFAGAALTGCFCSPPAGDPVHLLVLGGGRQAHLHPAGGNVGATPQAEPQAVPPRTLLEERRGTPEDRLPAELRESANGILEKKKNVNNFNFPVDGFLVEMMKSVSWKDVTSAIIRASSRHAQNLLIC